MLCFHEKSFRSKDVQLISSLSTNVFKNSSSKKDGIFIDAGTSQVLGGKQHKVVKTECVAA